MNQSNPLPATSPDPEPQAKVGPKYPKIKVKLVGEDGNAMAILGAMGKALRAGGVSPEEIEAFNQEAWSGDYDHLLATCIKWVTVR